MADPAHPPEITGGTGGDTGVGPNRDSTRGIPRWVKVVGIVTAVLVLLIVAAMLTGVFGGEHGPARHISFGGVGGVALSSGVTLPVALVGRAPQGGACPV